MSQQGHAGLGLHSPVDAEGGESPEELMKRRQVVRRTRLLTIGFLVLLAIGAGRTLVARITNAHALEAGAAERAIQYVKTAAPKVADKGQVLALPGTLQGFVQTQVGARASGYLKRWTKDIGSRVTKGELLAEIETPEIDQQLSQAEAAMRQAQASQALTASTVARWEALRQKDVVSQQDLDERRSGNAQAQANVAAAEANVQRLRQTEGFKRVVAPFDGVITRRNVDVGDLIDAGGGGGTRALFTLSQTDPLRVYVNVPQTYAQLVKPGQPAIVSQSELVGKKVQGRVARTAGSIDTATRTMQIEISVDNRDGTLLPGAYVTVSLPLLPSQALSVPSNALMFRRDGAQVGVVDAQGKVHLRKVTLGRNYGESMEVLDGLSATDQMVLNPSDALAEGDIVSVAKAAPVPAGGPATKPAGPGDKS
ncbi:MAG: efflux RND transporter periplasmic adaptor subunit [Pseudomonadota bacterium]